MLVPLLPLAMGAIVAGYFGYELFVGEGRAEFWRAAIMVLAPNDTLEAAHHAPLWVKILPVGVAVAGILMAYLFYIVWPAVPAKIAHALGGVYRMVYNKYYFDELYNFLFVRPAQWLGRVFWQVGDNLIIDGLGPNGIARVVQRIARRASALQTGYVYHYAFAMVIGLAVIMTWFWVKG
jgi:NADH-quinone oxidoreductase subunit L